MSPIAAHIVVAHPYQRDPSGRQLIVEVWRRGLAAGVASQNSRWIELTRHLRRIRVPVALAVDSIHDGVAESPDSPTRLHITNAVRAWLAAGEATRPDALEVAGLPSGSSGSGLQGRTELLPIRTGSAATRGVVISAIEQKVKRYRKLVARLDVPLLVVLSADTETGLSRDHVENTLAGHNTISVSIPLHGVGAIDTGQVTILPDNLPPTFDRALSGVAWLEVNGLVPANRHYGARRRRAGGRSSRSQPHPDTGAGHDHLVDWMALAVGRRRRVGAQGWPVRRPACVFPDTRQAGIFDESTRVVDVTNGARLETYVIEGERGSGVLGINGAAVHLVGVGDLVIVIGYRLLSDADARGFRPRVVHVDAANRIIGVGADPGGAIAAGARRR